MSSSPCNDFARLPYDIIFDVVSNFVSYTDLNPLMLCSGPWRKTTMRMLKSINRGCYSDEEGLGDLEFNSMDLVHFQRRHTSTELARIGNVDSQKITEAALNYFIREKLPDMTELHNRILVSKHLQAVKLVESTALDSERQQELFALIKSNSRIAELTLLTIDANVFGSETDNFLSDLVDSSRMTQISLHGELNVATCHKMINLIKQTQFQQFRIQSYLPTLDVEYFEAVLEAFLTKEDFQPWIQKFMFEILENTARDVEEHVLATYKGIFQNETGRIKLCELVHPNKPEKVIEIRLYQLFRESLDHTVEILLTSGSASVIKDFWEYEGLRGTIVEAMEREVVNEEDDIFQIAD